VAAILAMAILAMAILAMTAPAVSPVRLRCR
jgi:hypothetical protein